MADKEKEAEERRQMMSDRVAQGAIAEFARAVGFKDEFEAIVGEAAKYKSDYVRLRAEFTDASGTFDEKAFKEALEKQRTGNDFGGTELVEKYLTPGSPEYGSREALLTRAMLYDDFFAPTDNLGTAATDAGRAVKGREFIEKAISDAKDAMYSKLSARGDKDGRPVTDDAEKAKLKAAVDEMATAMTAAATAGKSLSEIQEAGLAVANGAGADIIKEFADKAYMTQQLQLEEERASQTREMLARFGGKIDSTPMGGVWFQGLDTKQVKASDLRSQGMQYIAQVSKTGVFDRYPQMRNAELVSNKPKSEYTLTAVDGSTITASISDIDMIKADPDGKTATLRLTLTDQQMGAILGVIGKNAIVGRPMDTLVNNAIQGTAHVLTDTIPAALKPLVDEHLDGGKDMSAGAVERFLAAAKERGEAAFKEAKDSISVIGQVSATDSDRRLMHLDALLLKPTHHMGTTTISKDDAEYLRGQMGTVTVGGKEVYLYDIMKAHMGSDRELTTGELAATLTQVFSRENDGVPHDIKDKLRITLTGAVKEGTEGKPYVAAWSRQGYWAMMSATGDPEVEIAKSMRQYVDGSFGSFADSKRAQDAFRGVREAQALEAGRDPLKGINLAGLDTTGDGKITLEDIDGFTKGDKTHNKNGAIDSAELADIISTIKEGNASVTTDVEARKIAGAIIAQVVTKPGGSIDL